MKAGILDLSLEMRKTYFGNLLFKNPGTIFVIVVSQNRNELNFDPVLSAHQHAVRPD